MCNSRWKKGMHKAVGVIAVAALASGCASKPVSGPVTAADRVDLGRISCDKVVQPEQQVQIEMIDSLMSRDRDHAALAKLEDQPLSSVEHWLRYGQLKAATGSLDQAAAVFSALVDRCGTGESHHGLGMVLLKQDDVLGALDHLKIARDRAPASSQVRNDYGYILMLVGRYEEAAYELRTSMELSNGQGPVRQNLAVAFLLTDDEDGLRWMKKEYEFSADELAYAERLAGHFVR